MGLPLVILEAAEILEKFRDGTLPARWQMVVPDGSLLPLVRAGDRIELSRQPRAGALCCVADGKALVWRRILALRPDGQALLRRDSAPMADGWVGGIVGSVGARGPLAALAERAPGMWTLALWHAGLVAARSRHEGRRMWGRWGGVSAASADFQVRQLLAADMSAYADLIRRGYGRVVADPSPLGTGFGLFVGTDLVGAAWLAHQEAIPELRSLVVDPAYRGKRGGSRLTQAVLTEAVTRKIPRLRAYVHVKNFASLAVFRRAGFTRTGGWLVERADPLSASRLQQVELEFVVRSV